MAKKEMAEIKQTEWDAHQKKVDELHTALLGDKYGNKGYMHRLQEIEEHVEDSKKRIWVERGLLLGLSVVWAAIVKFWDNIFGQ